MIAVGRFFQRLWAVQDKHGLNPGSVGQHSTQAYLFPTLPWIDAVLDGERDWNLDATDMDWIDYYPVERMRAMSVPHNWGGVGICWMSNFSTADPAKRLAAKTSQAEYVWMHDSWINPYLAPGPTRMPRSILDWGLNGDDAAYHPYWRDPYSEAGCNALSSRYIGPLLGNGELALFLDENGAMHDFAAFSVWPSPRIYLAGRRRTGQNRPMAPFGFLSADASWEWMESTRWSQALDVRQGVVTTEHERGCHGRQPVCVQSQETSPRQGWGIRKVTVHRKGEGLWRIKLQGRRRTEIQVIELCL